jgi:hypothetical protein
VTRLQTLVTLRELRIANNRLASLSTTVLKYLTALEVRAVMTSARMCDRYGPQVLDVAGNRIKELPTEIGRLVSLRSLTLAHNLLSVRVWQCARACVCACVRVDNMRAYM